MSSKYLGPHQIRGVEKLGDALLPGGSDFPSFSQSGCARHLDRILDYMPAQDLKDLRGLLTLMGFLPFPFMRGFIALLELGSTLPSPVGALLRTIRLGVRGLIMSLYYGDSEVLARLDYRVGVYVE